MQSKYLHDLMGEYPIIGHKSQNREKRKIQLFLSVLFFGEKIPRIDLCQRVCQLLSGVELTQCHDKKDVAEKHATLISRLSGWDAAEMLSIKAIMGNWSLLVVNSGGVNSSQEST